MRINNKYREIIKFHGICCLQTYYVVSHEGIILAVSEINISYLNLLFKTVWIASEIKRAKTRAKFLSTNLVTKNQQPIPMKKQITILKKHFIEILL